MTKRTTLEMVQEFHETYGLPVEAQQTTGSEQTKDLRINLLQEELDELKEALANNDIVETLDALIDLQYVLDGAFLSFGLQNVKMEAFDEVHRSNMSKLMSLLPPPRKRAMADFTVGCSRTKQ